MGDPAGVGAEVVVKALARLRGKVIPFVFGDAHVFAAAMKRAKMKLAVIGPKDALPKTGALVAVTSRGLGESRPGDPSAGGSDQLAYLEAALDCVLRGEAAALVTAPVSKAAIQR